MAYILSMDVVISILGTFRWMRLFLGFYICSKVLKDLMAPLALGYD